MDIAENRQIAVEKFRYKKYDLVLVDMQMPVTDVIIHIDSDLEELIPNIRKSFR